MEHAAPQYNYSAIGSLLLLRLPNDQQGKIGECHRHQLSGIGDTPLVFRSYLLKIIVEELGVSCQTGTHRCLAGTQFHDHHDLPLLHLTDQLIGRSRSWNDQQSFRLLHDMKTRSCSCRNKGWHTCYLLHLYSIRPQLIKQIMNRRIESSISLCYNNCFQPLPSCTVNLNS